MWEIWYRIIMKTILQGSGTDSSKLGFSSKTTFIKNHFHQEPFSSRPIFIKNHLYWKPFSSKSIFTKTMSPQTANPRTLKPPLPSSPAPETQESLLFQSWNPPKTLLEQPWTSQNPPELPWTPRSPEISLKTPSKPLPEIPSLKTPPWTVGNVQQKGQLRPQRWAQAVFVWRCRGPSARDAFTHTRTTVFLLGWWVLLTGSALMKLVFDENGFDEFVLHHCGSHFGSSHFGSSHFGSSESFIPVSLFCFPCKTSCDVSQRTRFPQNGIKLFVGRVRRRRSPWCRPLPWDSVQEVHHVLHISRQKKDWDPQMCKFGLSGCGPPGLAHDSPRTPNVHIWWPRRFKTPPKFHEKTPRETQKQRNGGGRGKKTRNLGP